MVVARELTTALEFVDRGYTPLAGGTDLMVLFNAGKLTPRRIVSIRKVSDFGDVSNHREFIDIGSAVTFTQLRYHPGVCAYFPLLEQSASWTGSIANQNRGTLGGNIANASPAADSSPVLLVYEAQLKLVSTKGDRWLPYSQFHLGYKSTALKNGELIAALRIPKTSLNMSHYGRKVGTRRAQAISKISFAAVADKESRMFRIAVGSVAPVPLRCFNTELFLAAEKLTPSVIAQAKALVRAEISPISDIRSTADYRAMVTENLLGEFLETLL